MPSRALHPCSNCRKRLTRDKVCDECKGQTGWNDPRRGSRHERGYGSDWDKLRLFVLERDHYLCQVCLEDDRVTPCNIVDHIKAKAEGGTDDPENLRAICKDCHATKTGKEGARGRGG